ncbi:DUF1127 domain-containing protein [Pseudoruegeria sp. SHC-113]|uniref:DUF1127 domain-containing protein n=1 Tax=Pseudoruegeria sp. SHC-113 TaxID=2855439 RepID=UPI0021BA4944|nr:DUF1127 domain-containing protein [Pseudoruegeria sp. SHC-113]MCT8159701.1 DUF1127 domain-containing protein [Pseudoruegeria sp. SHC-113]
MQAYASHTRGAAVQTARRPFLARLLAADAAWRQRQALKALDAAALADIGLTRAEAEAESARPFWDVPATWRN